MNFKIIKVGRAKDNDIVLTHSSVSRYHCELFYDGNGNIFLTDKNSLNGTYINGRRISTSVQLQPNDIVKPGADFPLRWKNFDSNFRPWDMEIHSFCMLMHLSLFASYFIPLAGIILPIVMWTTNKDKSPLIDQHGKNIINWMISFFIYIIISSILILIIVGIFALIALVIMCVIFIIIGALKANNKEIYKYPLSIQFLK